MLPACWQFHLHLEHWKDTEWLNYSTFGCSNLVLFSHKAGVTCSLRGCVAVVLRSELIPLPTTFHPTEPWKMPRQIRARFGVSPASQSSLWTLTSVSESGANRDSRVCVPSHPSYSAELKSSHHCEVDLVSRMVLLLTELFLVCSSLPSCVCTADTSSKSRSSFRERICCYNTGHNLNESLQQCMRLLS